MQVDHRARRFPTTLLPSSRDGHVSFHVAQSFSLAATESIIQETNHEKLMRALALIAGLLIDRHPHLGSVVDRSRCGGDRNRIGRA
jgi:hypothetical protein